MSLLRRPSQAELDLVRHAEQDALIMKLFDLSEGLERGVAEMIAGHYGISPLDNSIHKRIMRATALFDQSGVGGNGHWALTVFQL